MMNEDVKALKSELALLKLQFSMRVDDVESRLNSLLTQEKTSAVHQEQNISQVEERDLFSEQDKANQEAAHQETAAQEKSSLVESSGGISITADEYLAAKEQWQPSTPPSPSFITLFFQTLFSSIFDWFTPVVNIYQSYKARGMLGIFILTIVGISLTLAGFGYLMQLLIDQLGVGAKSLLMSGAAVSVVGVGIFLKAKTRFGEFATAIVTLGILLSYSTVYFSGSVYGLLPNALVLTLYLVIALFCHALALWLDTKVVAALGVIGIASMPILSNAISVEPVYYLLSLAFVVCSSLILAYRHLGQWLAQLSLAFTLVSLEWLIGFENLLISAWSVNLFYLLFFAYVVVALFSNKNKTPENQTLAFLAAAVGAFVLLFFQATDLFSTSMSINFAINALAALVVSVLFYRIKRELTHFFILLSASWFILTIVSAISDAYWGIAWAVEGILLLTIARRYNIASTINQGQILIAIALLYSWSALALYFPLPALKSADGWLLSIMIIAIVATWQRLITNTEIFNELTKNQVKPFLQLIETVWLSVLVIACANIWLGNWAGAIVIYIQIALLFRARNCQQVSIEVFAAILIIVPLSYAYQGALMSGSYRFMMLPLFAKFAVISAFIQLWLWSAFYRKYQPNSSVKHFAEGARIFFYLLIPVCWVGSVIRRFDEEALMLLWLSPLIALLLARKVSHQLLFKETQILTGLASISFVIGVGQLSLMNSLITLFGFSVYYAIAYFLNRKGSAQIYLFICSWGVLSLGLAIPNVVGFQANSLLYGLIVAALYWATLFNSINLSEHLKRNQNVIIALNLLLVIGAWLLIPTDIRYALVPSLFLIAALYQKENKFKRSQLGKYLQSNSELFLHSVAAISYVILCFSLEEYRLDLLIAPALAVHGALILFLKDRRITTVKYSFVLILLGIIKLAMIDAANALLWQKVILFMGIGIFILAASFWYQKLISKAADNVAS